VEGLEVTFRQFVHWESAVIADRAHNPKVAGSNPARCLFIGEFHLVKAKVNGILLLILCLNIDDSSINR